MYSTVYPYFTLYLLHSAYAFRTLHLFTLAVLLPAVALRVKGLTWGIKGVGAQGDGSVQMLARGRKEQAELTRVLKEMGEG